MLSEPRLDLDTFQKLMKAHEEGKGGFVYTLYASGRQGAWCVAHFLFNCERCEVKP